MKAPLTEYDERLLRDAADCPDHPSWKDLSAEVLREVAARKGADFATALLYDRLIRSPEHGWFYERVQSLPGSCEAPFGGTLAIVPGACYREYPQTGADGRRLREVAAEWGWKVETISIASLGALSTNARMVSQWLAERPLEPIVLVSLSKGGADVKTALAAPEQAEAFRNVVVWINLSGILHGTPVVSWFKRTVWRRALIRFLCWRHGFEYSVFEDLDRSDYGPLAPPLAAPPWLRVVHIVGFPLLRHLKSKRARRGYRRIGELGPSDGGGIVLGDLARLPGVIYPVWGVDHYLDPDWDVRPLVRRILSVAVDASTPWEGAVVNAQGEPL
jgi:hypothetical protein